MYSVCPSSVFRQRQSPLSKDVTKFGPGGDITPMSFAIVEDHAQVEKTKAGLTLIGGKGETYVNGKSITLGKKVKLKTMIFFLLLNFWMEINLHTF